MHQRTLFRVFTVLLFAFTSGRASAALKLASPFLAISLKPKCHFDSVSYKWPFRWPFSFRPSNPPSQFVCRLCFGELAV